MTIDISEYYLLGKRQLGIDLLLFYAITELGVDFPHKVLELKNVAMFFDIERDLPAVTIKLNEKASAEPFDTAMRLQREEVQWFKEVLLLTNATPAKRTFRAVAENIEWRNYEATDNYNP